MGCLIQVISGCSNWIIVASFITLQDTCPIYEYTRYVGNVEVGARVNTRNSIKSIFRTPVKSGLFLLLIAAVTAFLYLSINTWFASAAMLRDAEDVYTTIVTFKFRDTYGASEGYKTPEMQADAA